MHYGNTEIFLTPAQREDLIQSLLGQTVELVIDRPIGYTHVTKGVTLHYTVNYGYIPGLMGGDGEEQDVYVLGVTEPLSHFRGRIIGAIRRRDDNEDKLVAAPEGMEFHQAQIAQQVHFVEKYFDSTVDSLLRRSCGVIPFRNGENGPELLVVLQSNGCWSFPKGHMEPWESEEETALRETREETGLTPRLVPGFRQVIEYPVRPKVRKQVVLFLGEVQGEPILDSGELKESRWLTPAEAKNLMKKDQYPVLDQAEAWLRRHCNEQSEDISAEL